MLETLQQSLKVGK